MVPVRLEIEIPDDLAARAQHLASDGGITVRDLAIAGLRVEIERRSARARSHTVFPTCSGHGLVADVTPREAIARSYE